MGCQVGWQPTGGKVTGVAGGGGGGGGGDFTVFHFMYLLFIRHTTFPTGWAAPSRCRLTWIR